MRFASLALSSAWVRPRNVVGVPVTPALLPSDWLAWTFLVNSPPSRQALKASASRVSCAAYPFRCSEPSADISTPYDGETVEKGSTLSIRAQAIDETAMGEVEFYVNGRLECTDAAAAPDDSDYACSYSVPKGKSRSLTIEARAIDATGNEAIASVQVSTVDSSIKGKKK